MAYPKVRHGVFLYLMLIIFNCLTFTVSAAFATASFSLTLTGSLSEAIGRHLVIKGNYAYAVDGDDTSVSLTITNITNPSNPVLVSKTSIDNAGTGQIAIEGNYVYLPAYNNGLKIIDVSNLESPAVVGSLELGEHSLGVAINGNYAYVANGWTPGNGGLKVVDVSDPTSPSLVGNLGLTDYARAITIAGNYAYIGDTKGGLKIVDIATNPVSPALVGSIITSGSVAGRSAVMGKYVYMDDGEDVRIIDITDPTSPVLTGSLGINTNGADSEIFAKDNYIYAIYNGDLRIINVEDPLNPVLAGNLCINNSSGDASVMGSYVYVSDGGLKIVKIQNIANNNCGSSSSFGAYSSLSSESDHLKKSSSIFSSSVMGKISSTTFDTSSNSNGLKIASSKMSDSVVEKENWILPVALISSVAGGIGITAAIFGTYKFCHRTNSPEGIMSSLGNPPPYSP